MKDVEMKIFWKKMDFFLEENVGSCGLSFLEDCIERENSDAIDSLILTLAVEFKHRKNCIKLARRL